MQSLEDQRIRAVDTDECAARLLDTLPLIMRILRTEIRNRRPADLSVPQFRVLAFLSRCEGASLSDVTEHIGLTLPTMSKMIDALVARKLVIRGVSPGDRRRVALRLTDLGKSVRDSIAREAQSRIAELLAALPPEDRRVIAEAMRILQAAFGLNQSTGTDHAAEQSSGTNKNTNRTHHHTYHSDGVSRDRRGAI